MSELRNLLFVKYPHLTILNEDSGDIQIKDESLSIFLNISRNISKVWLNISREVNEISIFNSLIESVYLSKNKLNIDNILLWSGGQISKSKPDKLDEIDSITFESEHFNTNDDKKFIESVLQTLEIYSFSTSENINISELEGTEKKSYVKKYERSNILRQRAIDIHGTSCKVCGISFKDKYGAIGDGFIHIHHLEKVADSGERFVDPLKDLIPVCPNCHAMLHTSDPPLSPKTLKEKIKS